MKAKSVLAQEMWGKLKQQDKDYWFVARRLRGRTFCIERYPKPSYTRTSAQDEQRNKFKSAVNAWNALSPSEKEQWNKDAEPFGLTGYQYFIQQYLLAPPAPAIWYKVTIDNTANSNTLTDYQILINIQNDEQFFNDCQDKREAIRLFDSDKETSLSYWIEQWDTTNHNAKIWVKVPSIPGSASKDIYISVDPDRTTDNSSIDDTFIDDISNAQLVYLCLTCPSGTLPDLSGNNYDGTIYGATCIDGKHTKALSFDGINDYVQIGDVENLRFTASDQFTILVWIKTTATERGIIFGNYRGSAYGAVNVELYDSYNGNFRVYLHNPSGTTKDWRETRSLADNTWHFLGMTYNNNTLRMYRDGSQIDDTDIHKQVNDTLSGILYNSDGYRMGKDNRDLEGMTPKWYDGIIDELLVFDTELTLDEINAIYNNLPYVTANYPHHVLVRKYATHEPTVTYSKES